LESYQERKFATAPSNPVRRNQNRSYPTRATRPYDWDDWQKGFHAFSIRNCPNRDPTDISTPAIHPGWRGWVMEYCAPRKIKNSELLGSAYRQTSKEIIKFFCKCVDLSIRVIVVSSLHATIKTKGLSYDTGADFSRGVDYPGWMGLPRGN
jgi:hypothetical protein